MNPYEIASLITEDPNVFYDDPMVIFENFEQGVNPSTQDFWRNIRQSQHPFAVHPVLALYGMETAEGAYGHSLEQLQRAFPQLANMPPQQVPMMAGQMAMRAFQQVAQMERPFKEQLEHLAVELVSRVWGIPAEMLDAKLEDPRMIGNGDDDLGDGDMEEMEEGDMENVPIDREQVNKRITMNALTQGAAVHNMASIHHAAADEIQDINPQLLQAYGQFATGSTHMYWLMDFANMARQMLDNATVGTARVVYGDNEDQDTPEFEGEGEQREGDYEQGIQADDDADFELEAPEDIGNARVVARAINFPVLVQELVKGTMELLSHHGLEGLSREQLASIYQEADRLEDEPWLIQVGPQLWRSFLKIVPQGHSLADVVATLAAQEPQLIHRLLSDTLDSLRSGDDPAGPRETLIELMAQLEEETPAQFDREDYEEIDDEYGDEYGEDDDEQWDVGEPTY
jgi:hypothetical protein